MAYNNSTAWLKENFISFDISTTEDTLAYGHFLEVYLFFNSI